MTKQKKQKFLALLVSASVVAAVALLVTPFVAQTDAIKRNISADNIVNFEPDSLNNDVLYLSDYDYLNGSNTRYGSILKDQASNGQNLTLKYDDSAVVFKKGIWAHAASNVYYDLDAIRDTKTGYDYLSAYVGLNTTSSAGNGVIFWVYGSNDPEVANGRNLTGSDTWTVIYNEEARVATPGSNADHINLDVSGYRFIRLQAADNGGNASDHSVWADIKLVKSDYRPYVVPAVAELDEQIRAVEGLNVLDNVDHEMMVLRRELVKNAGQYTMTAFIGESDENREMMNWLYNDVDALRMYTTGGKPTGTYLQSFEVLSQLYKTYYAVDVEDGGADSEMYLKMMISLSLTHSKQVRFWIRDHGPMAGSIDSPNISRPIDRYAVYKRMYKAGKLNQVFKQLEVEEMRYVMFTELGDDELEWLRDWLPTINKGLFTYPPVPYISIGNQYWWDVNYDDKYVDPKSGKTWADRYHLIGANYTDGKDKSISGNYFIGFEPNAPHLWMINYYGGVCWQISNFGQNMTASYGVPSTTFGQPGHLAYANYEMGSANIPAWALTNDVSGWAQSNFTGYTNTQTYHPVRQMNNWGATDGSYELLNGNRYNQQGSYVTMSQAAINDFENYEKSQLLVKLAGTFNNDLKKQEEIYREALAVQDFNFDAWYGLLANYVKQDAAARQQMESMSGAELAQARKANAEKWYNLASEMSASRMRSFAVPYYDLVKTVITKIPTDDSNTVAYNLSTEMLLTRTLKWMAENNTNANIDGIFRQAGVTRTLANTLLGRLNNEVAVFSFDGDDAGVLKLGAKYENSNAAFDYSLDGGETWSSGPGMNNWVTEKRTQLTDAQISQINVDDDIRVHIQGVNYSPENVYVIDIEKGVLPNNLYGNDKENRVVGVNEKMEWCEVKEEQTCDGEESEWVSYRESSPLRVGDISIKVRVGMTGRFLPSDPSGQYDFTTDTDPETRRYIPVSHLSVAAVSSQATGGGQYGNAIYALDGNFNTRWHSAWNGSDHNQWIVVKFDHAVELAALGYIAAGGGNGRILQADFYVSDQDELKAENFRLVGKVSNNCSEAPEGVLCDSTVGWPNKDNATVNALNPRTFEFRRTEQRLVGDAEGDEAEYEEIVTHEAITAKYVAIKATQTSNYGNFIAARMLNFYEDRTKNPTPVAGVAYSTIEPTSGSVIARLVNTTEDEIEVLDENNNVLGQGGFEHIFNENGEYTFRFRKVGGGDNIGTAIAKVDWIMRKAPIPVRVEYVCMADGMTGDSAGQAENCEASRGKVNRSVSAKLVFEDNSQVKILNNGYQGEYGDGEYDSEAPDTGNTEKPVNPDGDQMSTDENSLDPFSYLFMRNGRFTFEYEDLAGNEGAYTVKVDWIDKAPPKVEVQYSTTEETDGEVVATVVSVAKPEESVDAVALNGEGGFELISDGVYDENGLEYDEAFIMTNNEGKNEYRFDKNGEFTFEYRDAAGNKGAVVAKVDWITEDFEVDVPIPDNPDHSSGGSNNPDRPGVSDGNINEPEAPDDNTGNTGNNVQKPNNNGPNNTQQVVRPDANSPSNGNQIANTGQGSSAGQGNMGETLTVETIGLPEKVKTQSKKLVLSGELRTRFGSNSEYYELNFVGEDGENVAERPEQIKIKAAKGKKLVGVYLVQEDGTTKKVAYELADDGEIVIKNPEAGKYLFDYEDNAAAEKDKDQNKSDSKEDEKTAEEPWYKNPVIFWGGIGAVVVVVLGIGISAANNRKR